MDQQPALDQPVQAAPVAEEVPFSIRVCTFLMTLLKGQVAFDSAACVRALGCWVGFGTLSIWLFHFFSAGDVSYVMTLGVTLHIFGMIMLLMHENGPSKGKVMSQRALELLMVGFALRLSVTTRYQGYLPTDVSGDGFFQACEVASFALCFYMWQRHEGNGEPSRVTVAVFAMLAVALGFEVRGTLNARPIADAVWAAGLYIQTLGWLVQLLHCSGSSMDHRYVQYCIPIMADKILEWYFWYLAYDEIQPNFEKKSQAHGSIYFPPVVVTAILTQFSVAVVMALMAVVAPTDDPTPQPAAPAPSPVVVAPTVAPVHVAPSVMEVPQRVEAQVTPAVLDERMFKQERSATPMGLTMMQNMELPEEAPRFGEYVPLWAEYEDGILTVEYRHVA